MPAVIAHQTDLLSCASYPEPKLIIPGFHTSSPHAGVQATDTPLPVPSLIQIQNCSHVCYNPTMQNPCMVSISSLTQTEHARSVADRAHNRQVPHPQHRLSTLYLQLLQSCRPVCAMHPAETENWVSGFSATSTDRTFDWCTPHLQHRAVTWQTPYPQHRSECWCKLVCPTIGHSTMLQVHYQRDLGH